MLEKDRLFIQNHLPFYQYLNKSETDLLLSSITHTKYEKDRIMHGGKDNCSGLFLVKEGMLRAFIISENGKEMTLYRLLKYDICIFSSACIFKNIAFDIFVEASENSEVFIIPSKVFDLISQSNIKVLEFSNDLMQARFSEVMDSFQQTIFSSFEKRLSYYLLEEINIQESNILKLTHEKIAKDIASAREVVSRMLKDFENKNYLKISRGKIEVINRKKLEEIAY